MIKAVIFDCFGVLFTDGWIPFVEKYLNSDIEKRQKAADYMVEVNRGNLGYRDFVHDVAALAGIDENLAYKQITQNAPNEKLFDYIANDLKPKFRIGLLSNTGRERVSELFSDDQFALFDKVGLSYATGYLKPQREAYELTAQSLDAEVGECVLIDDQERWCEGARAAGMLAICYTDLASMKVELDQLLASSN